MWSIALIVGVAAVASTVLLAVGVVLAVWIERQRYCRYLEQHNAGTDHGTKTSVAQSVCESVDGSELCMSVRVAALRSSPDTWVTLPSTETIDQSMNPVCPFTQPDQTTMTETVPKPTNFIKKKHRNRRRLKRTVPLREILGSPLPAITEQNDSPVMSPLEFPPNLVDPELMQEKSDIVRFGQPVRLGREMSGSLAPESVTTASMVHSSDHDMHESRPPFIPKSISTTSSISLAPGEPLPPLPPVDISRAGKTLRAQRNSTGSVESISSSVLAAIVPSPKKSQNLVQKPRSQALQDFDFGLSPIMRLRSPRLEQDSRSDVNFPKIARRSNLTLQRPRNPQEEVVTTDKQNGLATDFTGQHSVFDNCGAFRTASSDLGSATRYHKNDPFVADNFQRPALVGDRFALRRSGYLPCIHCSSSYSIGLVEGHETQECTPAYRLPIIGSTNRSHQSERLDSVHDCSSVQDGDDTDFGQAVVDQTAQCSGALSVPFKKTEKTTDLQKLSIVSSSHEQDTPESCRNQYWRFDLIPPDTPNVCKSASPLRSYESLVLRSPAHASVNARTHIRRNRLAGPRSAHNRSQSPLKPRTKSGHGGLGLGLGLARFADQDSTTLFCNASPASLPSDLGQESAKLKPEFRGNDAGRIERAQIVRVVSESPKQVYLSTSHSPASTSPTTIHRRSRLTARASKSSESVADSSIWEDASVLDESPEPDLPVLTPVKSNRLLLGTDSSPTGTPRTKIEDYEVFVNMVKNYGKDDDPQSHSLNVQLSGTNYRWKDMTAPGTQGSMYDASGFSKI